MLNFVHGDHSNGEGSTKSNSADVLDVMAGQDLTYYFPPPLVLGCAGLVTDNQLSLTRQNFTDVAPLAHHISGALQTSIEGLEPADWYSQTFFPKMKPMRKGPLVIARHEVAVQAADPNIMKYVSSVLCFPMYDITDKAIGSGESTTPLYTI